MQCSENLRGAQLVCDVSSNRQPGMLSRLSKVNSKSCMHIQEKAYLQHGHLKGSLQLMQGGSSQTATAAPDEAQRWGAGRGEVLVSTSQQHLQEERMVNVYMSHLLLVDLGMSSILTRML